MELVSNIDLMIIELDFAKQVLLVLSSSKQSVYVLSFSKQSFLNRRYSCYKISLFGVASQPTCSRNKQ